MAGSVQTGLWGSKVFSDWLNVRVPPEKLVTLDRKKVFILPTREGMYFALLLGFMLVAAINYQNSLMFAFAFLLASLFMVGMLHTYRNLAGLTLQGGATRHAFVGEDAAFEVVVGRRGPRRFEAIEMGWDRDLLQMANLLDAQEYRLRLFVPATQRGRLDPGRLLVETRYPLGLFRAWSWVDLDVTTLVFPRPIADGYVPDGTNSQGEGELVSRDGADDFYGFREYSPGDPLKHVAWKAFARSDELLLKQFVAQVDRRIWLDWDHHPGVDVESRLSRLCHWAIVLGRGQDEFGLRLPGKRIEPGRGEAHTLRVLTELALFESQP